MNNLVSIIIPCFNAEKYIEETIQSVINQTYKNWELLLINDGSTDNSIELVKDINDDRITIINKNNSGVSDTRNFGLLLAKGDFIAFLDADDVWHNQFLEKQINLLLSSEFDLSYTCCQITDEKSIPSGKVLGGESNPTLDDFLSQRVNYNTNPSGILFKKETLKNFTGFDLNLSNNADQDILIQLVSKGYKIGLVDEVLWDYRMHNSNMSKNISVLEKDSLYLFKKCSSMGLFKSFWFERKCYSKMYYMLAGSWWKDGHNKKKGLYYIFKAITSHPYSLKLFLKK